MLPGGCVLLLMLAASLLLAGCRSTTGLDQPWDVRTALISRVIALQPAIQALSDPGIGCA